MSQGLHLFLRLIRLELLAPIIESHADTAEAPLHSFLFKSVQKSRAYHSYHDFMTLLPDVRTHDRLIVKRFFKRDCDPEAILRRPMIVAYVGPT